MSVQFAAPKVFISYAWESRDHKQWVKELAVRLRVDGVELILDQFELWPGDQLPEFMEKSVRTSDAVLIVCTPSFKEKSDKRAGGVGYEGSVITAEVLSGAPRRKFIPLLRRGEWKNSAPSWLLGTVYLDFRRDADQLEEAYSELLATLHGRREAPPPIGSPPFPKEHRQESISNKPRSPGPAELASYPFVVKALLDTGRSDPATHDLAKAWLMRSSLDDASWPFVWTALMDAKPHDDELADMGRAWLVRTSPNDASWTYVWNTLMNARPHDSQLADLGRAWLLKHWTRSGDA